MTPDDLAEALNLIERQTGVIEALTDEVERLRREVERQRKVGEHYGNEARREWATALVERDASRTAHAAIIADLRVVHQPEEVPESQHYYCDPDDCNRAGEGALVARCKVCETVYPCYTAAVIARYAGAGSEATT